jgi:hypothetical protein
VSVRDIVSRPGGASEVEIGALIAETERHPDRVLFSAEEEINDRGSTHPNSSRRLLYLWRNRDEFSAA